ncbi:PRTase-like protein [Glarea lozoyensis ATCC 20868]|uniref:uracil phosphoribosyltransferase n=2 Tax=Glarea lozoyensis TaxID=101852 RepID=S3CSZ9_GLAL2|nr:PRTase-like protein [Glarea lozoyensis ATCC 20868]EHL03667.1 putative uracil phosphoribosyltransferase urg2 [Glarea lozoyensis 74030]EPE29557.1 PRTase-like protein [Glarea lozoyensis ATCC 20868]
MSQSLPKNVHCSTHPCLQAKLSQLRGASTNARETKALVHEIALIIGCEALGAGLSATAGSTSKTPLGYDFTTTEILPSTISIVPILRSGLGMLDAVQTLLPNPVPVHHLGLFREPTTLEPVEYYNNLPHHRVATSTSTSNSGASDLAILLDPVIATGGTCAAAIQTLKEWGVKRVIVIAILGAVPGLERAAGEWPEGVEIWVAGVDKAINDRGMIQPGLGDVGDRLFLTIGK